MIAPMHRELARNIRISPLLDVFDVGAVDPERNVVFGFAGDRTGMATYALSIVDYEAEIDHETVPPTLLLSLTR